MPLACHRSGIGTPLLLLHSTAADWRVWTPVLPLLEPRYDILAVDLPGFGESPALTETTTIATLAGAVLEFLNDAGAATPHVAGISLGGWLALELARRGTARSVTAFSPSGLWPSHAPRQTLWLLRVLHGSARAPEPVVKLLARTRPGRAVAAGLFTGRPWLLPSEALMALRRAGRDCPGYPGVYALHKASAFDGRSISANVPVTVAYGSRDLIVPRRVRRHEATPQHALWVSLPGCGHIPTWDDPQAVAALIDTTARSAG